MESKAISSVFGASASKVWSQQHKSMMGHALGAASAIESTFCIMALRDQVVPRPSILKIQVRVVIWIMFLTKAREEKL